MSAKNFVLNVLRNCSSIGLHSDGQGNKLNTNIARPGCFEAFSLRSLLICNHIAPQTFCSMNVFGPGYTIQHCSTNIYFCSDVAEGMDNKISELE